VLKPGEYPARFRVFGPTGTVWEKSATVTIPSSLPFAVPVLRETFKLKGPPGQYTFSANLERGGAATGGSLTFNLSNPEESPRPSGEVTLWGIDEKTKQWLTAHGLECRPFQTNEEGERQLILVGMPADAGDANQWELPKRRMTVQGANVVFLKAGLFKGNTNNMNWLPLKAHGTCINVYDWLYHKECVAQRHPVFQGLQGPGIMDMEYYGPVIPHEIFIDQDTPDETICAGFNTGYHAVAGAYRSSLLIALYRAGAGRLVLSTPYILENLDSHPAADRLLLNLLRYLSAAGDAPLGFSK